LKPVLGVFYRSICTKIIRALLVIRTWEIACSTQCDCVVNTSIQWIIIWSYRYINYDEQNAVFALKLINLSKKNKQQLVSYHDSMITTSRERKLKV
jgi:hypothetical protein